MSTHPPTQPLPSAQHLVPRGHPASHPQPPVPRCDHHCEHPPTYTGPSGQETAGCQPEGRSQSGSQQLLPPHGDTHLWTWNRIEFAANARLLDHDRQPASRSGHTEHAARTRATSGLLGAGSVTTSDRPHEERGLGKRRTSPRGPGQAQLPTTTPTAQWSQALAPTVRTSLLRGRFPHRCRTPAANEASSLEHRIERSLLQGHRGRSDPWARGQGHVCLDSCTHHTQREAGAQ